MRAALQPAVPSRRLLRFLRFQSEGIPFFNHGPASGPATTARRCTTSCQSHRLAATAIPHGQALQPPTRRLSTYKPRRLQPAPAFDLECILPRHMKRVRPADAAILAPNNWAAAPRRFASNDKPYDKDRKDNTASQRLWGPNAVRPDFRSRSTDELEETAGGSTATLTSLGRRARPALEPVLRCTEVDEKGDAILIDGAFKKSELIAKYGLMPRDLRKIDSSNLPHMMVRPSVILLNLLHLRVLIKHDRVLLFDVYGSSSSSAQSEFMYELQGKLRPMPTQPHGTTGGGLPYEFRALEVVLMSVTSELWKDFDTVQEPVMHLLSELEDDVDREKLRILLVLSKQVNSFEQKARLVRNAIEEVLEADDDLSEMYLTEKTRDIKRDKDDHTEVEMLLESYHKICDEVVQEASNLVSGIRNTEEIIRAILDANRNALMLLELKFSVWTLGVAAGTFVAGWYGMNLENYIEETNWGFPVVSIGSTLIIVATIWVGAFKLRKVQRVRMKQPSRKKGALGRGSAGKDGLGPSGLSREWYREDSPTALLEAKHREKIKKIAMLKEQRTEINGFTKWFQRLQ